MCLLNASVLLRFGERVSSLMLDICLVHYSTVPIVYRNLFLFVKKIVGLCVPVVEHVFLYFYFMHEYNSITCVIPQVGYEEGGVYLDLTSTLYDVEKLFLIYPCLKRSVFKNRFEVNKRVMKMVKEKY